MKGKNSLTSYLLLMTITLAYIDMTGVGAEGMVHVALYVTHISYTHKNMYLNLRHLFFDITLRPNSSILLKSVRSNCMLRG